MLPQEASEPSTACPATGSSRFVREEALLQRSGEERLGHFAKLGCEQGGIDLACSSEDLDIDADIGQRIQPAHRVAVAGFGSLNAQVLGLTVDAFTRGSLVVDDLVERALAIEGDTHESASF